VLNPAVQQEFVEEASDLFTPIAGGWGRMGMTHIRLAAADEETLRGALTQAWKLRVEKNTRAKPATRGRRRSGTA
jgi:hypothetical protein